MRKLCILLRHEMISASYHDTGQRIYDPLTLDSIIFVCQKLLKIYKLHCTWRENYSQCINFLPIRQNISSRQILSSGITMNIRAVSFFKELGAPTIFYFCDISKHRRALYSVEKFVPNRLQWIKFDNFTEIYN